MKPLTYFDVIGQQVATHPVQSIKLEMRAHGSLAANCFWQVHDTDVAPSAGAVPVKSWPAAAGAQDYKEFKNGELGLVHGLYVVMSTTEATLTAGTGNNKFAMLQVELTGAEQPSGTSLVGDLTTPVGGLEVWAMASGPKRLIRLQVQEEDLSADRYVMLFAHDSPVDGDRPIETWKIENGGDALDLKFGINGRSVTSVVSGSIRNGCTVALSDQPVTLVRSDVVSGDSVRIKAEYK